MKAFVCKKYGQSDALELLDVPTPIPNSDEILVRVKAVSVNSWDWDNLVGAPIIRLIAPFKPPYSILGGDLSGVVEAVGSSITNFKVGDDVYGDVSNSGWGGFAEFVAGKAEHFIQKPAGLSFEDAATLPQAGLLGYQGVHEFGQVKAGDNVLISGAGGGAGMFAIKLAKLAGAHVTGIDRSDKLQAMIECGADVVFDYQQCDYTKFEQTFDVIIDAVASKRARSYRRVLTPTGTFVMMGGKIPSILSTLIAGRKNADETQKFKILMWNVNTEDLSKLGNLVVEKNLKVAIHKRFSFKDTPLAVQFVGDQNAIGKVIISL